MRIGHLSSTEDFACTCRGEYAGLGASLPVLNLLYLVEQGFLQVFVVVLGVPCVAKLTPAGCLLFHVGRAAGLLFVIQSQAEVDLHVGLVPLTPQAARTAQRPPVASPHAVFAPPGVLLLSEALAIIK